MERISEHISWKEATFSPIAQRYGVKNEPSINAINNMKMIAEKVFEPLRKGLGDRPIHISSFYRSKDLNDLVGGVSGLRPSQHMCTDTEAAMDLDNDSIELKPTNKEIFNYIKDNLEFDQLIWEFGDNENPDWVHVSYSGIKNRKQILRSFYRYGGVRYEKY